MVPGRLEHEADGRQALTKPRCRFGDEADRSHEVHVVLERRVNERGKPRRQLVEDGAEHQVEQHSTERVPLLGAARREEFDDSVVRAVEQEVARLQVERAGHREEPR